MKNRAKCKLCSSIIESYHQTDYVMCKCGEIAVDGGESLLCYSRDFANFMRVDDNGHEIIVKVVDSSQTASEGKLEKHMLDHPQTKPTRKELLDMLDEMIKNIDKLPTGAMSAPITHFDFCSLLMLLNSIFRAD